MNITKEVGLIHVPATAQPEIYKAEVQTNARLMGYRLMQRRKGKDEYWCVLKEPGTLAQINQWLHECAAPGGKLG
jgi:hypothetical protein